MKDKVSKITLEDLYQLIVDNQKSNDRQFKSIDQRFDAVDQRFESIDQRFDAQDAYLEHSFMTIQQQFIDFQAQLDAIKDEINQIKNWFDKQEKVNDIEETERLAMGQKIERTVKWCKELANEIGYELKV